MNHPIEKRRLSFLVVDDEPSVRSLIRHAFESDGLACRTAGTIGEAADLMAAERFDGIVIDLEQQGEDAMTWLERVLHNRPSLPRSTVVAAASDLAASDRGRVARMGAVLLLKPFSLETLRSLVLDRVTESDCRTKDAPKDHSSGLGSKSSL